MTKTRLAQMTSPELFDEFLRLAIAQSKAMWGLDTPVVNRLFWKLEAVERELKSRPGDQRRILIAFQSHRDAGVRMLAGNATLAVDPVGARATLQQVRDRSPNPYDGSAGMTVAALDRGDFVPT